MDIFYGRYAPLSTIQKGSRIIIMFENIIVPLNKVTDHKYFFV